MHSEALENTPQRDSQSRLGVCINTPQDSICGRDRLVRGRDTDVTGRQRLVSNVLCSWCAYFVFFIGGFVLPRMIDARLGQESLGIWDFAWSLVAYFELVQMGINSSINRFVARYNAGGDIAGVNRVASSVTCVLGVAGLCVMGLTIAFSLLLPQWFGYRLGDNVHEAQCVVFFLGAGIAVRMSLGAFNGVLTGCHCWGLHSINTSGWYTAIVVGIIVALMLGEGLPVMAGIVLAGETLAGLRRVILAHRVCKGLRLRLSLVEWATIKEMYIFGIKTLIPSISNLLLNQTTSVLVLAYLGPAALALYTRPRSLILHVQTLVDKMAMTLTPTVSSLQSRDDTAAIKDLVIKSTRYSLYLALPIVLTVCFFGGPIMQLWMGPRYADGLVPAVLAIGYLPVLAQLSTLSILAGLNAHGRAGIARFVASLSSVGLNVLVLKYWQGGLLGTAIAVTLPLAIVNMVDIPLLICRRIGLNARRYYVGVLTGPVVHTLPFVVCLVAARLVFRDRPMIGLALGTAVGGTILAVTYWRSVLPDSMRVKMSEAVRSGGRLACGLISGK